MRIISKHSDYYDSARAFGEDRDLVYLRHTDDEFEVPEEHLITLRALARLIPTAILGERHGLEVSGGCGLIGFCGKLYPVWRVMGHWVTTSDQFLRILSDYDLDNWGSKTYSDHDHRANEKARETLVENFWPSDPEKQKKVVKAASAPPLGRYWMRSGATDMVGHGLTKPKIDLCRERKEFEGHTGMFVDMGIPVFFFEQNPRRAYLDGDGGPRRVGEFIANPTLDELGFASVLDPWTAYQELSMFVGGVLPRQGQQTVEIVDDEVIRDAKGHDDRSFKTASPGKKARRRGQ